MIQIRNGIFETNSSSSHAIVITKQNKPANTEEKNYMLNENGELLFYENDMYFGRSPFDILTDWYGRLTYALASFGAEKVDELEELCRKHIPGFTCFKFPKVHSWRDDSKHTYYGEVDHQSDNLLYFTLRKCSISLEDFIFNDKYIVVIDGDEYCVFDRMRDTPLFNNASVERIID